MKFLDLFGKTPTHPVQPVQHVRAQAQRAPSAEQRHATALKIDTIEAEIASETGAGVSDPVALLHQRIEEACLLHASGQSAAADAALAAATAVPVPGDAQAEQQAWLMRLELAGFAGEQARFEDIALGYAQRFETSPPQWRRPPASDAPSEAPPALSFRGRLCGSAAPALARLGQMTARQARFCLDLGGVTEVDAEGSRLLLQMLHRWRDEGRDAELLGTDAPLGLLRLQVSAGRRDPDDAAWLLLIELLRASGRLREHEEACLAYSLTYEVSPPAATVAPARAAGTPSRDGHLLLPAEIRLPVEALLDRLHSDCELAPSIVLDCRHLQRIDFAAAAPVLAGILRVARGKPVEWRDVPFLVSTLLQLVGGAGQLRIINRKP